MAIEKFGLTKGDLGPGYPFKVIDSDGNAVDLTGKTITCKMVAKDGGAAKINSSTGIEIANQVTNKGEADYNWQSGDTDTPGSFYISFFVEPDKITYPNPAKQGLAEVVIS